MRPESARICSLIWSTFFCTAAGPFFLRSVAISPSTAFLDPMSSPLYTVLFKSRALPSSPPIDLLDVLLSLLAPPDALAPLFAASSACFLWTMASFAASLDIWAFSCLRRASLTCFCRIALFWALCPIPLIISIREGRWHDATHGVDPQSTASTTLLEPLCVSDVATKTHTAIAPKAISMKAVAPRRAAISFEPPSVMASN
mmetsp:Transcript_7495/g.14648  ORF Transcript_7495/g.14648 Transcript_7495/m.14648 type:complete len:201 (-) Transcript_7495:14-616(-)